MHKPTDTPFLYWKVNYDLNNKKHNGANIFKSLK